MERERERDIRIYINIYIYYVRGFKSYPFTSFFGVHEGFTHFTWTVASVATLYPVMPCQFHHKRFGSVLLLHQYRAQKMLLRQPDLSMLHPKDTLATYQRIVNPAGACI